RMLVPCCIILDAALPDGRGIELAEQVKLTSAGLSVIFTMEQPDVPTAVRAMKAGVMEVLAKPISRGTLFGAIEEAIERSRLTLCEQSGLAALRGDYASLSKREREVMALIVSGLMNKQVGAELGIAEFTVKTHRGQAMRKMKARTFADL